jgi:hypothetical protein
MRSAASCCLLLQSGFLARQFEVQNAKLRLEIANALSRASATQVDVETLKTIVIFCGVGLVVSLLLAGALTSLQLAPDTNGLDIMYWI